MRVVPAIIVVLMAIGVAAAAMVIEAPKIEKRIAEEAGSALGDLGFSAEVDGRDVALVGFARDAHHRDQGLIRLAAIEDVDILRDHSVIVPFDGPYSFSATRMTSGEIYLHGVVPDDETRDAVAAHFEGDAITDLTRIVAGAPEGWGADVVMAASALDALVLGTAVVVDKDVTISGLYDEDTSTTAFERLSTPGWKVMVTSDPRQAMKELTAQAEALRADLRDTADAIERIETEAATEMDAARAEIAAASAELDAASVELETANSDLDSANARIRELEAMLGGVDSPPGAEPVPEPDEPNPESEQ